MVGRELIFSNSEIAGLITSRFVPYAGDQWYLHRQKDEDGAFFWKVAQQGHNSRLPEDVTRQGIYVATADGRLLRSDHFRPNAPAFLALLRQCLEQAPAPSSAPKAAAADTRFSRVPPEGGLILNSFTRIPLPASGQWSPNQAVGRDHMWLTRDEVRSLCPMPWKQDVRMPVPPAIAERLVRFHLVDNVRGEPNMWTREQVREASLELRVTDAASGRLALSGTARLATGDGRRGYDARLQGVLTLDSASGRCSRFDVLAWGQAWGEGTYTRGAPPGRFPLLIAFSLAGSAPADRVPPQASREVAAYFGTGRG